jgi:heat shock protein beta
LLDQDPEEEKEEQKRLTVEYKPLIEWMKKEAKDVVMDGKLTSMKTKCGIV